MLLNRVKNQVERQIETMPHTISSMLCLCFGSRACSVQEGASYA